MTTDPKDPHSTDVCPKAMPSNLLRPDPLGNFDPPLRSVILAWLQFGTLIPAPKHPQVTFQIPDRPRQPSMVQLHLVLAMLFGGRTTAWVLLMLERSRAKTIQALQTKGMAEGVLPEQLASVSERFEQTVSQLLGPATQSAHPAVVEASPVRSFPVPLPEGPAIDGPPCPMPPYPDSEKGQRGG